MKLNPSCISYTISNKTKMSEKLQRRIFKATVRHRKKKKNQNPVLSPFFLIKPFEKPQAAL